MTTECFQLGNLSQGAVPITLAAPGPSPVDAMSIKVNADALHCSGCAGQRLFIRTGFWGEGQQLCQQERETLLSARLDHVFTAITTHSCGRARWCRFPVTLPVQTKGKSTPRSGTDYVLKDGSHRVPKREESFTMLVEKSTVGGKLFTSDFVNILTCSFRSKENLVHVPGLSSWRSSRLRPA